MNLSATDTIAAIATPPGVGGVGIVRLSGPDSWRIASRLFKSAAALSPRRIAYGTIRDEQTDEPVDDALALPFRGPYSYTGEDVIEFCCHGGPVTLNRVLGLCLLAGARSANPGEFTRRAYMNGKMDLAQAEAVCEQIRARTFEQQRLAVRQREGSLSRRIHAIRDELVGIIAAVEVTIDYSEEVGDLNYESTATRIAQLAGGLTQLILEGRRGKVLRDGVRTAIAGRPNVGKSSLLNALVGDERAIVTPIAGTTRDTIEETLNIDGVPFTIVDTAGLRVSTDLVERMGIERSERTIETAALVLFALDASVGWTDEDQRLFRNLPQVAKVIVWNKYDIAIAQSTITSPLEGERAVKVSALTGFGLEQLRIAMKEAVLGGTATADAEVSANERQLWALINAHDSISHALQTTQELLPPDFISIDLHGALDAIGTITGETATEEIIHRIFSDFCVGK